MKFQYKFYRFHVVQLFVQVLGTPTREEIKCMNPNYTEFRFPQIKPHPWHKVCFKLRILVYNMHKWIFSAYDRQHGPILVFGKMVMI